MNDFKIIHFSNPHSYWLGDEKWDSVGHWISKFFPDYDEEFWSTHKALEELFGDEYIEHYRSFKTYKPNPDYLFPKFLLKLPPSDFLITKKKILQKWERKRNNSNFRGTKFHTMLEERAYDQGYLINPWDQLKYPIVKFDKEFDNESLVENLIDLPDGGYVELLVYDKEMRVCGQIDEAYIQTIGKKRYLDINDHKTNEKKPEKSSPERCYAPFNDQYASKHFRYTFQLNLYAHIMERAGYTVRNQAYTHYESYDESKKTRVDLENIGERIKPVFLPYADGPDEDF